MAAISNLISRNSCAVRQNAVPAARCLLVARASLRDAVSSAFRHAQEILCALWMLAALAFSLLLAAGFVA